MRYSIPVVALLACSAAIAQTITLAEGAAQSLDVVALPESNPDVPGTVVLQDIEFVPIEVTGRTVASSSATSGNRRIERDGLLRVELADGGRLFRYRRAGGTHWGFLHVAADGTPRAVLERPAAAGGDPFADRIGVGVDGRHCAVPLQSGAMWVVRLDGGVYASTGTAARLAVPPSGSVEPPSVMVGADTVFFCTENDQLMRCALVDAAVAEDVSPPVEVGGQFGEDMALAGDGSRVVVLYGPDDQQRPWTVGVTGGPTLLPLPASKYERPGYLPDGAGEPAMLLNHDGTRLFCIDSLVRDELFLVDLTGAFAPLQITEDAIFQPYIGVHVLPRFQGPSLIAAIGDVAAMDWFRAELSATGGNVTNLTATGSANQPFPAGSLVPVDAITRTADSLVVEQTAGGSVLRRIDTATGSTAIVAQGLTAPALIGDAIGGEGDAVVATIAGQVLFSASAAQPLGMLPPGVDMRAPATGPMFATTVLDLPGGFSVGALYLPDGTFALGILETGLRQLSPTVAGGIVWNGNPLRYLAPGVHRLLNRPAVAVRRCLSGGGG